MIVEHTDTKTKQTRTLLDSDNPYPDGLPENVSAYDRFMYYDHQCKRLHERINRLTGKSKTRQALKNELDNTLALRGKARVDFRKHATSIVKNYVRGQPYTNEETPTT